MTALPPKPKEVLILAAAALARAAPHQWAQFLSALSAHAAERKDEFVQSPVSLLQVTQGRAQECAYITTLFEDAVTSADRITTRRT